MHNVPLEMKWCSVHKNTQMLLEKTMIFLEMQKIMFFFLEIQKIMIKQREINCFLHSYICKVYNGYHKWFFIFKLLSENWIEIISTFLKEINDFVYKKDRHE